MYYVDIYAIIVLKLLGIIILAYTNSIYSFRYDMDIIDLHLN